MIDREKKWGDEMRYDLPWIEAAGGISTISVREFDMPQEFEIPDFLPQYWHWLSGIFF